MNILIMTIPVSITLAIIFLLFFLSAVSDDQFENLDTSAQLPLSDDEEELEEKRKTEQKLINFKKNNDNLDTDNQEILK